MAAQSPTASVKSREIIGGDQFSQRREVFEKHNTVFLPAPSPGTIAPSYRQVEPIVTSNHGKTTSNFKRNTSGYSSMRENRSDDRPQFEFRTRKYSDNFASELNQGDDLDFRYSTVERTRRLSKMRRDFLNSNLHEPHDSTFARSGIRASMPNTVNVTKYKIESPKIHKFPFAEPYATPTPVRRVIVDLTPAGTEETAENENFSPVNTRKHQSLPTDQSSPKTDRQKLFEELVKRYSPQRKPIDWTLPPTRPTVVGSVPKSTSSSPESVDNTDTVDGDEVFENKAEHVDLPEAEGQASPAGKPHFELLHNGPEDIEEKPKVESKSSLAESEEDDYVPELSKIKRQLSRESAKRSPKDVVVDLNIPALIDKMTREGEKIEHQNTNGKKVKRKRSFLDKLLGRKKDVKSDK